MAEFNKEKALEIIKSGDDNRIRVLLDDISNRLRNKNYGLVWEHGGDGEDSPFEGENVVLECSNGVPYPVLREDLSVRPEYNKGNMLLEGDNYAWLKILAETYNGQADVIYIDPPYNTGSKDFKYNDKFVDPNDSFFHSKWLDFMDRRLRLAKSLLAPLGIIFISIDEREYAPLKLLCDEIFTREKYVGTITWEKRTKCQNTKTAKHMLQSKTESVLVYKNTDTKYQFVLEFESSREYPDTDEKGEYRLERIGEMGAGGMRGRATMIFPIEGVMPKPGNQWKYGIETVEAYKQRGDLVIEDGKAYFKIRPDDEDSKMKPFWSLYTKEIGTAETAKRELTDVLNFEHGFETVKPVNFVASLIDHVLGDKKSGLVVDFFAGSGTTAHAVETLNAKDGGSRRWILITNNEDLEKDDGDPETGICRDITKPRIDTVITGIRPDGTQYSDGTDSGYSYFQYKTFERTLSKERNLRSFQRPSILDAFVMLKYGAHKTATNEENKAFIYKGAQGEDIVLMFGEPTADVVHDLFAQRENDEKIIAIVPDGSPIDMEVLVEGIEVVPFSKLTANDYLTGRR